MAFAQHLKDDVSHVWDRVMEGWHDFRDRATHALTKYQAADEHEATQSVGWGVLAADMVEHDDHFDIEVELPGMSKSDLSVDVRGNNLVISGQKRYSSDRTEGRTRIMERAYGRFDRVIPLAVEVDASKCEARYRDGVLALKIWKRRPNTHQITVSS